MILDKLQNSNLQNEKKIKKVSEESSPLLTKKIDEEKEEKYKKSYIVKSDFNKTLHIKFNIGREERKINNMKRNLKR